MKHGQEQRGFYPRKAAAIFLAGAALFGAYEAGQSSQSAHDRKQASIAFVDGKAELAGKTLKDKDLLKSIDELRGVDSESLSKLTGDKLFENASGVQETIFSISAKLGLSDKSVFESLVSEQVQEYYRGHNVDFSYAPEERISPDCFNPYAHMNEDGSIKQAIIPLNPNVPGSSPAT